MTHFICVPRGSDNDLIGGFQLDAMKAYQYTPKGFIDKALDKARETALLKIVIGPENQTLYFFGEIADNLLSQIEDKLFDKLNK